MADEGPYKKLQRLEAPENNARASKFYYHFLYKIVIVSTFLVVVPLLSSQAPEFVNKHFNSRSWELLQLIFVGIAVSYGLFSKRSDDSDKEKENSSTFDNAHSYISRLLQVSSVFDDETENPSVFDENNKIQTWNSQYYRNEPMVVVAKEDPVHLEHRKTSSFIGEKPLLLPVRSLKSRVSEVHLPEPIQTGSFSRSISGSDWFSNNEDKPMSPTNFQEDKEQNVVKRSGSKRLSSKGKQTRNQESGGLNTIPNMEEMETTVVHRSPIPWRSRSGRMVFKDDIDGSSPQNSGEDSSESNRLKSISFRSLSSSQSRIESNPPSPNKQASSPLVTSPKNLSPSPSWSGEPQPKRVEDFVRKKSFNKSSPPPPPPPPPPYHHKPSLLSSGSREMNDEISVSRDLRRSVRSMNMEFNDIKRVELPRRVNSSSEFMATANQHDGSNTRSVRTIRQGETLEKTMRPNEFGEDFNNEEQEKWSRAIEGTFGFGDKKELTNRMMHGKSPSASRQTFLELPEEEEEEEEEESEEFIEKDVVDTEEDTETETEDDFFDGNIGKEETIFTKEEDRLSKEGEVGASEDSNGDGGPDVDKKADEFIAKFREQIRLQRIQSIRRSSTQYPGIHSR